VLDVILDALALRVTEGYAAAAPCLIRALEMFPALKTESAEDVRRLVLAGPMNPAMIALEAWNAEALRALVGRQVQFARDTGALVELQSVNFLAYSHLLAGESAAAAALIEEARLIALASGSARFPFAEMMLAAWRGDEAQASGLIQATQRQASARGSDRWDTLAACAGAVLCNGLGRHDAARDYAAPAFVRDAMGTGPYFVPELVEAASRTGDAELIRAALEWLSERTRVTPTAWSLGIEARARALVSEGDAADGLYRDSIAQLGRTCVRVELARGHLLYGEWLRRERRRMDAREQLRIAYDMLDTMGFEAFAERARRELAATGETARKRTVETRDELTAQEAQIARLARDGLSNPEIGARLFISPGTVKYHLRKIFTKLDIRSRSELDRVLPRDLHPAPEPRNGRLAATSRD
jgi:ATP/maltotriose-dependent transcriptional regulator MalT